MSETIKYGM